MLDIKTITVIGANGNMGSGVAAIFASFGNAKVYMVCREMKSAQKAVNRAVQSVRAESIKDNLIPKTYDDLESCIKESDFIFESVSENLETKFMVNRMISEHVIEGTIIATGTSGLSINMLSGCFDSEIKPYYLGLHFYNPPYYMTLCEIVPSDYTDDNLVNEIKEFLNSVLFRDTVILKDTPAFLGNRIGFQFINEALQYAYIYKDNGGIDYIDSILGSFSGRSMSPLTTSDFVGLDVHMAIVDNIYSNTSDYANNTFNFPEFARKLVSENKLGRKTNCGLYQLITTKDEKFLNVYDIATDSYRKKKKYIFPYAESMKKYISLGEYSLAYQELISDTSLEADICLKFLIRYVIYSIYITKEICGDFKAADIVMASGYNWIPPLSVIDFFGGQDEFIRITELRDAGVNEIDLNGLLQDIPNTEYDYRRFLKAK